MFYMYNNNDIVVDLCHAGYLSMYWLAIEFAGALKSKFHKHC